MELKNQKEIELMREGGKILAHTLAETQKICKAGMTTLEIDSFIEKKIRLSGAIPSFLNYRKYPFHSCISINEELVHGLPSMRIIKNSDIIGLDIGVLYKGYHTDAAISFAIGSVSEIEQKLISVTKKSLLEGIKLIRPGVKIGSIQNKIQEIIEQVGFSVVRDLCGHGIGKRLQESPCIPNYGTKNTGFRLEKGMTFCLEPMVAMGEYKVCTLSDGWTVATCDMSKTAHFEHTIAVTENGHEILTSID